MLKEKRNRNSRGYITELGFDQHPELNSTGKSPDKAYLESQLEKVPRQCICLISETSNIAVWDSSLLSQDAN